MLLGEGMLSRPLDSNWVRAEALHYFGLGPAPTKKRRTLVLRFLKTEWGK